MARDLVEYSYRVRVQMRTWPEQVMSDVMALFERDRYGRWTRRHRSYCSLTQIAIPSASPALYPNRRFHNSLRTSRRFSNLTIHDAKPCECFLRPQYLKPLFPPQSGPRIQLPMCIPRIPRSIAPSPIPHSRRSSFVPLTISRRRARPVRTTSRFEHRR